MHLKLNVTEAQLAEFLWPYIKVDQLGGDCLRLSKEWAAELAGLMLKGLERGTYDAKAKGVSDGVEG